MAGYFENGRKAMLADLVRKRKAAEKRAERWLSSYGEVGCYPDLVATIHMLDDLIAVIDEPAS